MNTYQKVIKPFLFRFPSDIVHEVITNTGYIIGKNFIGRKIVNSLYYYENPVLNTKAFGIEFKNPVGIAGGFDKSCKLIQILPSIGFGFTEVGSITANPYGGNKRPWTVRLKRDQSLIINYGLRNEGSNVLKKRILKQKRFVPLIINIAKTNDSEIKGNDSVEDYNKSFVKLQPIADIVNLNISCPNTGDGQMFCENPKMLDKLLKRIGKNKITKPLVLKLKPDIEDKILNEVLRVVSKYSFVKGFIISNLTKNRKLLKYTKMLEIDNYPGGISGKPLKNLSNQMIKKIYKKTGGKYIIIGLGGVFTAEDAYEKICFGASLVELATGMIFGGPATIKRINQGLVKLLQKDGFSSISEAVGSKNN